MVEKLVEVADPEPSSFLCNLCFVYNCDRIIVIYNREVTLNIDNRDRNDHCKSVSEFTRINLSISIWSAITIIDRDYGGYFDNYQS